MNEMGEKQLYTEKYIYLDWLILANSYLLIVCNMEFLLKNVLMSYGPFG